MRRLKLLLILKKVKPHGICLYCQAWALLQQVGHALIGLQGQTKMEGASFA